ncbi:MAG: DUF2332 domain-containing protein [Acidimicrobiia bacterium]|nr:DUF2332 domain-containing protein [Acidimicrobiia bacterium]
MGSAGVTDPRAALAELFRMYEIGCSALGSPLWAAMCTRFAFEAEAGGPVFAFLEPHAASTFADAYPLRMLGGLHRLALNGDAPELAHHLPSTDGDGHEDAVWDALGTLIASPPAALLDALTRPPQTNEVGRSASLIGGFLVIADETRLPLRVLEIGASAGLNLRFDQFRYEQDDEGFGPIASPVRFPGYWPFGSPPFDVPLVVDSRRGCDVDPIDVSNPDERITLLSYVWPDQRERFERTTAAIDIAALVPAVIDRADAAAWLGQHLAEPAADRATVVFHSIMWQYLDEDTKRAIRAVLELAGAAATSRAPLAWLRLEPDEDDYTFPRVRLTSWPGGTERLLAHGSFHLGAVTWMPTE